METLQSAKEWLDANKRDGAHCPCCGQFAKIYKRKLYTTMAKMLIVFSKFSRADFHHIVDITRAGETQHPGDFAKLAYWGLIEEQPKEEGDTKKNSGYWRITNKGIEFTEKRLAVPQYIILDNAQLIGFEGKEIFIDSILNGFNYHELMGA